MTYGATASPIHDMQHSVCCYAPCRYIRNAVCGSMCALAVYGCSDLDTSVGHYPYGIIWLTPYWAPLDHGVAIDVSVGYM